MLSPWKQARLPSNTQCGKQQVGRTTTAGLLEPKGGRQTCLPSLCLALGASVSLAGSYWSVPDPHLFLPCFPISHLAAFLNDSIGKLFSKATVNYSISSISQPLREAVQSLSWLLLAVFPEPSPATHNLTVGHKGREAWGLCSFTQAPVWGALLLQRPCLVFAPWTMSTH